eukprot:Em0006g1542a
MTAYDQRCRKCQALNHFAKVCKKGCRVHLVEKESSIPPESEEVVLLISVEEVGNAGTGALPSRWEDEMARMVRESPRGFLAKGKKLAYTFKKKGNEIQSAFIDRVTERVVLAAAHVERAMAADESGAVHLTKAREDLEEGIKILTHRQKMIKFADRSDAGRALVEEYEDDALASNPEDERKMEKAERAAEKKVAKKRKLRESKTREEAVKMGALRPSIEPGMAFAPTKPPMAPKLIGGMVPRPSGSCFHCGGPGHFGRECPKALASVAYPLPNVREHMAGESLCFRGEVVENVTHGGVERGKELTPDIVACVFATGAWPLLGNLEAEEIGTIPTSNSAKKQGGQHHQKVPRSISEMDIWCCTCSTSHLSEELHLVLYTQHLSEELHLVLYMQHLSEELHLVLYMQHLSEELHLVLYTQHLSEELHLVLYTQHLSEELHLVLYMQHLKVRLLAVCLVAYAGFMRCEELVKLRGCDVTFNAEGMVVKIESSKTDQYREGASLVIAHTGQVIWPVAMMERYCLMGEVDHTSQAKLFRGIVHAKSGERLRKDGGLSYTTLRELLVETLAQLGFDPALFGMHSLRAGGATAAANAGVEEDRLFKRHGRWKSESAKDGYVKDSLDRRLKVSWEAPPVGIERRSPLVHCTATGHELWWSQTILD